MRAIISCVFSNLSYIQVINKQLLVEKCIVDFKKIVEEEDKTMSYRTNLLSNNLIELSGLKSDLHDILLHFYPSNNIIAGICSKCSYTLSKEDICWVTYEVIFQVYVFSMFLGNTTHQLDRMSNKWYVLVFIVNVRLPWYCARTFLLALDWYLVRDLRKVFVYVVSFSFLMFDAFRNMGDLKSCVYLKCKVLLFLQSKLYVFTHKTCFQFIQQIQQPLLMP